MLEHRGDEAGNEDQVAPAGRAHLAQLSMMPATAKQAARTNQEHDDGGEIDDDLVDAGDDLLHLVHRREGLQDAEEEAGKHGAGQRAHAADHHHDEGEDQELHAHAIVGRDDRRIDRSGDAGDDRGKPEDDGEAPLDVDAEEPDRVAVAHAGAQAPCRRW